MNNDHKLKEAVKSLTEPANFYEQVDGVCYYIFHNANLVAYYDSLKGLSERVKAAILLSFRERKTHGYHAEVLRAALIQYDTVGHLDRDMPVRSNFNVDS